MISATVTPIAVLERLRDHTILRATEYLSQKSHSMPRYRGGVHLSLLDNVRSRVLKAELFDFNNEICFTCSRTYGIMLRSA